MLRIQDRLEAEQLTRKARKMWELSGTKIRSLFSNDRPYSGTPVFTKAGIYQGQAWTEWTEGFHYGSALLQFDATGDSEFLELGRRATRKNMAKHVTHMGVHDHGFNNVSTYGSLLRLMHEGKLPENEWERSFYELALCSSGAVQAARWTTLQKEGGYIYSFNGPHSLFVDTLRSLRSLAVAYLLGHELWGEQDERISLLRRLLVHAETTAAYSVYYGEGRDIYDVRGRVAHESIFNTQSGLYRCPNSQQGYSGFSTWTRGLAWAMLGFSELLEFLGILPEEAFRGIGKRLTYERTMLTAARATCDFYIEQTPTDGIPYWDTGAPHLSEVTQYLEVPADPHHRGEPVDSSAAAIAAQGLLRLGRYLEQTGEGEEGRRYFQAGLTVLSRLLEEPYLSVSDTHQGLLLHSLYHRPNGWDSVEEGETNPSGESCMWGDYHLREAALYVRKLTREEPYLTFFGGVREVR